MFTSTSTHGYSGSVIGGGGHLSFSIGHFLGQEVAFSNVLALAITANTGPATLSPTFSVVVDGSWLKKAERSLDPSVVERSVKLEKTDPKEWELDNTSKTTFSYPRTSD